MSSSLEKTDLAGLFREIARRQATHDSHEIQETLRLIKDAASKGKTYLKVNIDYEVHRWLSYSSIVDKKSIKPDYLLALDNYGFTYSDPDYTPGLFSMKYTLIISWR